MSAFQSALATEPTTVPVAYIGSEVEYIELHLRRLGEVIELRIDFVQTSMRSGRYDRETLAVEHLDDEEDAISTATDLEHLAANHLRIMDVRREDWVPGDDFAEAVERIFTATATVQHLMSVPLAAE
jgi:hypothetical protein